MSSMPSENRANPSATGSPQRALRSTEEWIPPKLVDGDQQRAPADQCAHRVAVRQLDGDHPAEAPHLHRGDRMRRIVGQTGIADRLHRRVGAQHQRDRRGVLALPFEPQPEAADAAQHQPGLERARGSDRRAADRAAPSPSVRGGCPRRSRRGRRGVPTAPWWRWRPRGRRPATAAAAPAAWRWCCRRRAGCPGRGRSSPADADRRRPDRDSTASRPAPRRHDRCLPRRHTSRSHRASTTVTPRGARNSFA